jgi:hypothetical protein
VVETFCEVFSEEPATVTTPVSVTLTQPAAAGASGPIAVVPSSAGPSPSTSQTQEPIGPTHAAPSTLSTPRARGCRIQLVIVYLVVIAILKSIGIGWVPIATGIARDFVRRCRARGCRTFHAKSAVFESQ